MMNKHYLSKTFLAGLALSGWLSLAHAQAEVYFQTDFDDLKEMPSDFMVLDGDFALNGTGGNGFLELAGTPLTTAAIMFGPNRLADTSLSAKMSILSKGRSYPSVGLGLNGLGGYRLLYSPAKRKLELFEKSTKLVAEAPIPSSNEDWVRLRLQVRNPEENNWIVEGKVWAENESEPSAWSLSYTTAQTPFTGKATLIGIPYSGKPIAFDEVVLAAATTAPCTQSPLTVGIQSWSLRNMNFDQVVEFALEHKIKDLQLIGNHLDPHAPWEEIEKKKAVLDKNGLTCYTFGVAGTSLDQSHNRRLFEFAKYMGCKLIVVEPNDFKILDLLEELVREFDIRIAIHNHGIRSMYGNPLVVRTLLRHRDPRMGVCLDTGHVTGAGFDVARVYKEYEGRVFDLHLKDKKTVKTEGNDVILDVEIGTGDTNFKDLFPLLVADKYAGILAIETDNGTFAKDPKPFIQKAIDYVNQQKKELETSN